MASPTRWTWVWVNSGSWWWTGRPGMLRVMGSQRAGHDWVTELNWTELEVNCYGNRESLFCNSVLKRLCILHDMSVIMGVPWWHSGKNLLATAGGTRDAGSISGSERSAYLEQEMATHSNILAWKTPWKEEPGGLQCMGSQRVRHDWAMEPQWR